MSMVTQGRNTVPLLVASFFLLAGGSVAQAVNFCAKTGNDLNAALNAAGLNQEDDVIKVARGTHITDVEAIGDYQWQFVPNVVAYEDSVSISGGWNPADNCNTQTSLDPTQTVLDARYFGPGFTVQMVFGAFTGAVSISNLTFTRGQSTSFTASTGIDVVVQGGTSGSIVVDNILVINGRTTAGSASSRIARFDLNQSGSIKVRNSQFLNNSLTHGTSGGVRMSASNGAIGFLTNNSISGNSATINSKGLEAIGVVTLINNASADNLSTASSSWDFYSNAPTSLTMRNNHFETRGTFNGTPFSETGGTTGDAGWALVGFRMVPNAVSALRDTGINNPTGGVPNIDFSGATRIINGTIDRGAVEAPAITRMGPTLTATNPINNSVTPVLGNDGDEITVALQFAVSGGLGAGTTTLTCMLNGGPIAGLQNAVQTIAVGGSVTPVFANVFVGAAPQNAAMSCTAVRENATSQSFFFNFAVGSDAIFANSFE